MTDLHTTIVNPVKGVQIPGEARVTRPVTYIKPLTSLFVNIQGRATADLSGLRVKVMLIKDGTVISIRPLGSGIGTFHVKPNAKVVVAGNVLDARSLYGLNR